MKQQYRIAVATVGLSAIGGCMASDDPGAGPGQVETSEHQIWTGTVRNGDTSVPWELLTPDMPTTGSGPAVTHWGSGKTVADQKMDVFWRAGNHLMHMWWEGDTWWPAEDFGTKMSAMMRDRSQPTATSRSNDIRDVFWRGSNDHLMHIWYENGWWGPQDLGGTLASSPATVSWGTSALHVFWKGSNGNLQWKTMDYATNTWKDRPDIVIPVTYKMASDPAAMYRNNGIADIFWQGPKNRLEHIWSVDGVTWSSVQEFSVLIEAGASPTATPRGDGEVHVFWRDTNSHLQYMWMDANSNWSSATDVSASKQIGSSPGVTSWSPTRLDVFAQDRKSGKMAHRLWSRSLNVDVINQETGGWCWAAVTQMIMRFYGAKEVSQCQQANDEFKRNDCCCDRTQQPDGKCPCDDIGGLPCWTNYGFIGKYYDNSNPAPFEALQGEVANGRPWEHDVTDHTMVGVDAFKFNGDEWVVVNNPDHTGQYMMTYAYYKDNPVEHNHAAGDQFVTRYSGPPHCP